MLGDLETNIQTLESRIDGASLVRYAKELQRLEAEKNTLTAQATSLPPMRQASVDNAFIFVTG